MVHCKDDARKYCWDNNRVWNDKIWDAAHNKAMYMLANNKEYLSKNTSKKRKDEIELAFTSTQFFAVMNTAPLYRFVENRDDEYDPDSVAGTTQELGTTREDDELVWSDEWNGMYKKRELRYLDDYFQRLQDEFVIDNVNREDYARRVAKASLEADNKYQKMRQGTGTAKEWQEAQSVFDMLSKSASFAESQRKEVTNTSMNALSTIIMDIELNHHNEMPKVTFEKDDIDLILKDFGFTGEAIA